MILEQITHPKKRAFLAAYGKSANITRSAAAAEMDPSSHFQWMRNDPIYAEAFEEAKPIAMSYLEDVAMDRAVAGSDVLLIFLLKGGLPEKYRERRDDRVNVSGESTMVVNVHRMER